MTWPATKPLPIDPRDNSADDKRLSCPMGSGVYLLTLAPGYDTAERFAHNALRLLDEKVAADPGFSADVAPLGDVTGWRVAQPWELAHSARPMLSRAVRKWRRDFGRPPVIIQVWRLTRGEEPTLP
jgi:hypothetical protein